MDINIDFITIALVERCRVAKAFFSGLISLEADNYFWRAKIIKDLTTLYALRELCHYYADH